MSWLRLMGMLFVIVGCKTDQPVRAAADDPATVIEMARQRPLPDQLRARFGIRLRSPKLDIAGTTTGGLIADRPEQGRLDVFGPFGNSLVTVAATGGGADLLFATEKKHYDAPEAEAVLREVTAGLIGLDDFFGLLLGDLPLDDARVRSLKKLEDGTVEAVLAGPRKTMVRTRLDPRHGAPVWLAAIDRDGSELFTVDYEGYSAHDDFGEPLFPDRVTVTIPVIELTLDFRMKAFKALDEVPDVFVPEVPDSFVSEPIETAFESMAEGLELKKDKAGRP